MKEARIDRAIKILGALFRRNESSGTDILESLEEICEANDSHLYALMNEQIIRPVKLAKRIKDYKFRAVEENISDKQKLSRIFGETISQSEFAIIASYPPGKLRGYQEIEQLYPRICRLILSAKKNLLLINPYFDEKGLDRVLPYLVQASNKGVKIRMVSRKGDESNFFFETIKRKIKNNLEIKEFGGSGYFLHAKCIIADDKSAYIGSANITATSLGSNLELGVLFSGIKVKSLVQFIDSVLISEGRK